VTQYYLELSKAKIEPGGKNDCRSEEATDERSPSRFAGLDCHRHTYPHFPSNLISQELPGRGPWHGRPPQATKHHPGPNQPKRGHP